MGKLTTDDLDDLGFARFCEAAGTRFTGAKGLFRGALVITGAGCPGSRALWALEGALLTACVLALVATRLKAAIVLTAHGWTVCTEWGAGYEVAVATTVGVAVFKATVVTSLVTTVVKAAWLGALGTKAAWVTALVATVVTAETALLLLLALVTTALVKAARLFTRWATTKATIAEALGTAAKATTAAIAVVKTTGAWAIAAFATVVAAITATVTASVISAVTKTWA
jgi:hypothetical protein